MEYCSFFIAVLKNHADDDDDTSGVDDDNDVKWENVAVVGSDGVFEIELGEDASYVVYFAMLDVRSGTWDEDAAARQHLK
jgi:hypothetical protein